MASALDRVYQELAPDIRFLSPSCRSRALLLHADLAAFLQRLSACRPEDRVLVVVEAPELHCFLALQDLSRGQGENGLSRVQLQVVEALCKKSFGSQAPPIAGCRKALRAILLHYDSDE